MERQIDPVFSRLTTNNPYNSRHEILYTISFFFSVPAFLTQGPPVLLHPERVVSLSQSEQFERSFQPNVALAPPVKTAPADSITFSKVRANFYDANRTILSKKLSIRKAIDK